MDIGRREFLAGVAVLAAARPSAWAGNWRAPTMYGLIGKMNAVSGQRDALIAILNESVDAMPGCLSYVIATDPKDVDAIWITEVWESAEHHKASLALPSVKTAIARGRPLIASFGEYTETVPVGIHNR